MKTALLFLIFISQLTYAQTGLHMNKWHFGNYCALDFQSGSPVAVAGSPLQADEGCATISDPAGNLLFFTNGIDVWDATNTIMPNGSGINGKLAGNNGGTASDVQAPMILREPGAPNRYYVFTIDDSDQLWYSVVDMTLGANGDVVPALKNQFLAANIGEGITATRHSNTTDWWVIAHSNAGNTFYVRQLSASGVSGPSTVSLGLSGFRNHMKMSYNGAMLGHSISGVGTQVLDFNNTTGTLSNPRTLVTSTANFLGVEFSPSSQFLYTTEDQNVYQYDVTTSPISSSRTLKGTLTGGIPLSFGSMQLGPDGIIYIAKFGLFPYTDLAAIVNPDLAGAGYNNSAATHGATSLLGLPQFYELSDPLLLPIELLDFSVQNQGSANEINWSTASERNNDYFLLERSADGVEFSPILRHQGAGNTSHTVHYTLLDASPLNGMNYYRLKQVDFDGKSTYSSIKAVSSQLSMAVSFSPNPAKEAGYMHFTIPRESLTTISILDMQGRTIHSISEWLQEGPHTVKLDVHSFIPGTYIIHTSSTYHQATPIRFIKK